MFKGFRNCCTAYIIDFGNRRNTKAHLAELQKSFSRPPRGSFDRDWTEQIKAIAYVFASSKKKERSRTSFLTKLGFTQIGETPNEILWSIVGKELVENVKKLDKE